MADTHLSGADTLTLHRERDPLLRSTIVALAVLDRAPDWDRLSDAVERATRLEPSFRRRLSGGSGPFVPPRWVDDPDFDLSWHLRRVAVPQPATMAEVLEFARVAGTTNFDPARPRWEFTLMEGLDDGAAALVMKVHHTLTDGTGGLQLARHVVDHDRTGSAKAPVPEPARGPTDHLVERTSDAVTYDLGRAASVAAGAIRSLPRAASAWARRPLSIWTDAWRTVQSAARLARPLTNTLSPVMVDRRLGWHYQLLDVPFGPMQRAGAAAAGTFNDAFMAAVAGGLARYHEGLGSLVEELRVTMPISPCEDDGPGADHVELVRFPVPVGDHDPVSRMMAIDHATYVWRHEPGIGLSGVLAGALNLLPTPVSAGTLRHVDVLASNVAGFDDTVYLAGSRLERLYSLGPTVGAAASITLTPYRDRCYVGLTTDTGAVPDHEVFAECLAGGFAEVVELGG